MSMNPTTITPDSNHSGVERFGGFSIREDASAAATINFRKASASGAILFTVNLVADESATLVLERGINAEGGVYVEEVSGSITGTILGY